MSVMGKEFRPFSFGENIPEDIFAEYHHQAFCKVEKMYKGAQDISCDLYSVDVLMDDDSYTSFAMGMCGDKVAMRSENGEVIIVCDIIE